jgi:hypothetical protein
MTCMRSLLLLLLTCMPVLAQDPEGQPAFVRVRFVGQATASRVQV